MIPVGPITLTLDVPTIEDDPAQAGGPQSVAVQIQNSSPFVLTVLTKGDSYTIQPRIAQTVPVSGQPVSITPTQQLAGGTPDITIVWLLAGEQPPMHDGPLPSPSNVLPVSGNIDLLAELPALDLGTAGSVVLTSSAFNSYETIAITLGSAPNTAPLAPAFQVAASPPSGSGFGRQSQWQTAQWKGADAISPSLGIEPGPLYIPSNVSAGDVVTLNFCDATFPSPGTSLWNVSVFGLGNAYNPSPLRADGRLMPVGAQSAYAISSSAPGDILAVATPPSESCVLVHSGSLWTQGPLPAAGSIFWFLFGTVGGNTYVFASAIASPLGLWVVGNPGIPDSGLLCDPGQPVNLSVKSDGTVQVAGSAAWDLVI